MSANYDVRLFRCRKTFSMWIMTSQIDVGVWNFQRAGAAILCSEPTGRFESWSVTFFSKFNLSTCIGLLADVDNDVTNWCRRLEFQWAGAVILCSEPIGRFASWSVTFLSKFNFSTCIGLLADVDNDVTNWCRRLEFPASGGRHFV